MEVIFLPLGLGCSSGVGKIVGPDATDLSLPNVDLRNITAKTVKITELLGMFTAVTAVIRF